MVEGGKAGGVYLDSLGRTDLGKISVHCVLLYRAEAPNVAHPVEELRYSFAVELAHPRNHSLDKSCIVGGEAPLVPPFGGAGEGIDPASADRLAERQDSQRRHHDPGRELPLARTFARAGTAKDRRREIEGDTAARRKGRVELGPERRVG